MRTGLFILTLGAIVALPPCISAQGFTRRVNVNSLGALGDRGSSDVRISADGSCAVFSSDALNLDGAPSGFGDVYLHDLLLHRTERVSLTDGGGLANKLSELPRVSGDGQRVAFVTYADNLVAGDTNSARDVYLRDRAAGSTQRISLSTSGEQSNNDSYVAGLSADGRYVLFSTRSAKMHPDGNTRNHFYLRDTLNGTTTRTTETSLGAAANQDCRHGFLSAQADWVVFSTISTNLPGGAGNSRDDVYIRNLNTGVTEWISSTSTGGEPNSHCRYPSVSADGRWVVFQSAATNLVPGDTNGVSDIFLRDRQTGSITRISQRWDGSEAARECLSPRISEDGNTIVYQTTDPSIVPGDNNNAGDVFAYSRVTGLTQNVNLGSGGVFGNDSASDASISADGNRIAFASCSSNLIGGTTMLNGGLFVHTRTPVTSDPIQLTGPTQAASGDSVSFYWSNGTPFATEWFSYSLSNAGRNQYGHNFDLGLPVQVLFQSTLDANGGDLIDAVIPAVAAGRTFYLEVVAYDGITIQDSNLRSLQILP
ncbi:MAG: hypothetical protein CMJ94_00305 [Planctomycetes bacterium]|nr:hypothetical protein [Planctomycetota bacterium]